MKQPEHWKVTDTLKHQYVKQVQILTCTAKFIYATSEIRLMRRILSLFVIIHFFYTYETKRNAVIFTKSPPAVAVERWVPKWHPTVCRQVTGQRLRDSGT